MALTGAEYLESMRDGREVWLHGEKVAAVTTHPGFENSARFLASLYDTLHEDQHRKTLTWTTPRGAVSHKAFMVARTRRHLNERIAAMEVWARKHYGFMGRTPDYKGGLAVSLGSWPEFFGSYADNCTRWYEKLSDNVLFMNHIGVNPMVDRSKQPHELPDVNVRAVRETDSGIVVRGAKMVGTAAVFTHCNLVFSFSPVPLTEADKDQALVFIVRIGEIIGTEFGGPQELFERNYAGNEDNVRLEDLFLSEENGDSASMTGFVDQWMADSDLNGWAARTPWSDA